MNIMQARYQPVIGMTLSTFRRLAFPTVQAGTLLSVLGYMLYTEPRLGLVVLLIAVPEIYLVPVIQRRINVRVKERARTLLRVGDLIVDEMRNDRGSDLDRRDEIGEAFLNIYGVRLRVFRLKFGLKLLVSALQSAGVFVLLFVGGIMVIAGKTEIGIVVAFISGLDRVLDPWRELIAFVRSTSAAKVQFDLIEGALGRKLAWTGALRPALADTGGEQQTGEAEGPPRTNPSIRRSWVPSLTE